MSNTLIHSHPERFVVTTSVRGSTKTQIWDAACPLALGHPFRFIIERTADGARVRDLSPTTGEIYKNGVHDVSNTMIDKGKAIELDSNAKSDSMTLIIRRVGTLLPAFDAQSGNQIRVFICMGEWVMSSEILGSRFVGQDRAADKPAFKLSKKSGTVEIEAKTTALQLQKSANSKAQTLEAGKTVSLTMEDLAGTILKCGNLTWRFAATDSPAVPATKKSARDAEALWFQKTLRYTSVAFSAFLLLTWIWPKPDTQTLELVPAQFAKIVMAKPKAVAQNAGSQHSDATQEKAQPKTAKAQNTAVAQAFRNKALQNAVSGLLKGGMSKLLAQSDFVSGSTAAAGARKILNTKSDSLLANVPDSAISNVKGVQVASIGNDASVLGAAKGVGYGKGNHANVDGQGHALVSIEGSISAIEEGLTKDEVGEVIHRHISEVRYCYESAMIRNTELEGKLVVNFTIGGAGMVTTSAVNTSTLQDARLDDCILRRLGTWKFPQPKGGINVAVTYPFIFKTLGR